MLKRKFFMFGKDKKGISIMEALIIFILVGAVAFATLPKVLGSMGEKSNESTQKLDAAITEIESQISE